MLMIEPVEHRSQEWKARYRERLRAHDPHCHYCGRLVSKRGATLDHVVPECRGGHDVAGNMVLSCRACNQFKGPRTPSELLDVLTVAVGRLREFVDAEAGATG